MECSESSGKARFQLFLLGFITLFLELALIRYMAGNVYNLGYFPNLILLGVFIGMGIGFVFHHHFSERSSQLLFQLAMVILLLLILLVYFRHPAMPGFATWSGNIGGEVYWTAVPRKAEQLDLLILVVLFFGIVLLYSLISQRTAKYFARFAPLQSYTLDIIGSCCGILVFMLISWLQLPAYAWFILLLPAVILVHDRKPNLHLYALLLFISILAWRQDAHLLSSPEYDGDLVVRWSPYQKLEFAKSKNPPTVFVNGIYHQYVDPVERLPRTFYQLPYQFARQRGLAAYKNVLVIGAGSGNDVVAALMNGAEHVDAVEIDPAIAAIGMHYNLAQPYQDRRVNLVVDDGRAFLSRTQRKYDLIIFALTDSLVKVSPMAQIRLENYLFTEESARKAFQLLTENGILLFYNFYRAPFIPRKIESMVQKGTGLNPMSLAITKDFSAIIVGRHAVGPPSRSNTEVETPNDDWPFLYLEHRGIPPFYLKAMAALAACVIILALFVHYSGDKRENQESLFIKLAFIFMGSAFLLLETKSVIQFSLLFGTTWLNNSLVFLSVLLFVLAANWCAPLISGPRTFWIIYALLFGFCLAALAFPLGHLLSVDSRLLRFLLAAVLTFLPIFFANLIFSVTFRDRKLAEHLFGWNLIGAAMGGIIEYASMAFGYNALAALVAIFYTLVVVFLALARRSSSAPEARDGIH